MQPAIAERIAARVAGHRARLRRHELDRSPARGRRRRVHPARTRRGGAAQRRPVDARGAQPDRGRPDRLAPLLPRRPVAQDARGRGRPRPDLRRRRRHGRRDPASSPRSRARAFRSRTSPRSYVVATVHRQANVEQPRLGRIVDGLNRLERARRLPRAPAHPRAHRGGGARARRARTRHRAARATSSWRRWLRRRA